jgi:putative acetyltransferase
MTQDTTILLQIRHSSRELIRELGFLQEHYDPAGVTHSQCHALLELEHHGLLTAGELAERLRLEKSTVSRLIEELLKKGWVELREDPSDKRRKPLALTATGVERVRAVHLSANQQVQEALEQLSELEQEQVQSGLQLYAKALMRSRLQKGFLIRPVEAKDDAAVAGIIRKVMPEFGASGPGFALHDPEVGEMSVAYAQPGYLYFVLEKDGKVVGGGGIAPLSGGEEGVCELRKMYFLQEARGTGMGQKLLATCLQAARAMGYRYCYLETLQHMYAARRLYERFGFQPLKTSMGATGHHGCNCWYLREL